MSRATQTWIIVAALFVSVATLIYFFRPSAPETRTSAVGEPVANSAASIPGGAFPTPSPVATVSPSSKPSPSASPIASEASAKDSATGKAYVEKFDDQSLTFVPTRDFRRMIEYRITDAPTDSSCTPAYTAREKVTDIQYAYGFVIERFNTWNEKEGKQEYITLEPDLPNAFKGSLKDIVAKGRFVTVTKQRCGMGQIEGLIAVH